MSPDLEEPWIWELSEYVLRTTQQGPIAELFVEGVHDAGFFQYVLGRWGRDDVFMFDASNVIVSDDEHARLGTSASSKGTLVAIALALAEEHGTGGLENICVTVDRDYDEIPDDAHVFAVQTDGYSIESYAFTEQSLDRFATVGCAQLSDRGKSAAQTTHRITGQDWYRRLEPTCIAVAGVRLTLRERLPEVGLPAKWTDWVRVDKDGFLLADASELLAKALQSAGHAQSDQALADSLARWLEVASEDPFRWVRGHDFVALMLKIVKSSWGKRATRRKHGATSVDEIRGQLMLSVSDGSFDSTRHAQKLRERFLKV